MDLYNIWGSLSEMSDKKYWPFSWYSNFLRCICIIYSISWKRMIYTVCDKNWHKWIKTESNWNSNQIKSELWFWIKWNPLHLHWFFYLIAMKCLQSHRSTEVVEKTQRKLYCNTATHGYAFLMYNYRENMQVITGYLRIVLKIKWKWKMVMKN